MDQEQAHLILGGARYRAGTLRDTAGHPIALRPQSLEVLKALAAHPGEIVSKDDLVAAVWGDVHVTDDSLVQCIADIRRAIGDLRHQIVQTVPKRGYRLLPEGPGAASAATAPTVDAAPARHRQRLAIVAFVVMFLVASAWLAWPRPVRVATGPPSIAVLSFEDLTGDPRWARIGRGLGMDIAATLSRDVDLTVFSVVQGTVPAELSPRYVLAGSLHADDGRVRATAQLTAHNGGRIVWSGSWTLPDQDILAVKDRIIAGVVGGIGGPYSGAVTRDEIEATRHVPPTSFGAWELYLLGMDEYLAYIDAPDAPGHLDRALDLLTRAAEADPVSPRILDKLSYVQIAVADRSATEAESAALVRQARRNVRKAAALDPGDPSIQVHLAEQLTWDGDFDGAWQVASRAAAGFPNTADVLANIGFAYPWPDRSPEGRSLPYEWVKRAFDLNAAAPPWYYGALAQTAFYAGDLATARRAAQHDMRPATWLLLAAIHASQGEMADAGAMLEKFYAATPYRSLDEWMFVDVSQMPRFAPLIEGLRKAGMPITRAEALTKGAPG